MSEFFGHSLIRLGKRPNRTDKKERNTQGNQPLAIFLLPYFAVIHVHHSYR